jgi:hypothetical protein
MQVTAGQFINIILKRVFSGTVRDQMNINFKLSVWFYKSNDKMLFMLSVSSAFTCQIFLFVTYRSMLKLRYVTVNCWII